MSVTPYRLLGASELQQLKASLEQALGRWRGTWFGDQAGAVLAVMPACDLSPGALGMPDEASLVRSSGEEKWVAVFAAPRLGAALAAALRGPAPEAERAGAVTPLLKDAVDQCLAALCDEVLGSPAEDAPQAAAQGPSPRIASRAGSGSAAALIEIEGERLGLVLGRGLALGKIAAPRAAARGGVADRAQSIQNGTVRVRVMAGSAELDVAALSSVAPGDVILLDTALEATFALVNTEGLAIAKGYLGALGDRKAFQLTT